MSETGSRKLAAHAATSGLPGQRVICETSDELIDRLAGDIQEVAKLRVEAAGAFHLALSGGSTPQALYRRLMVDPTYRNLPWDRTHLWLVDERCVNENDDRLNFNMIRELIVDHSDIPASHVHPMPVLEADGDRQYESDLRHHLENDEARSRLDLILLGMGADGHTASLFPQTPALTETRRWVRFNDGDTVADPRPRMTMTYPLINAARRIAVLVTDQNKHATLQHVNATAASGPDVQRYPITGVRPTHESAWMMWYLDYPAALGPGQTEP